MKLDDLKLFVVVASQPSLREAASALDMQPGTLSKSVRRIEQYYKQELFLRTGTRWQLTTAGEQLHARALQLLAINETIETELGLPQRLHVRISGPEVLQARYIAPVLAPLYQRYGDFTLETFQDEGLERLKRNQVDLALISTTGDAPQSAGISSICLAESHFVIAASPQHPLAQQNSERIPIEEILEYPFVIPSRMIYGDTGSRLSPDGWHEESFPRRTGARVDNISALMALIESGQYLAYLPEYLVKGTQLVTIKSSGCPYHCNQAIWVCMHDPIRTGWLNEMKAVLNPNSAI